MVSLTKPASTPDWVSFRQKWNLLIECTRKEWNPELPFKLFLQGFNCLIKQGQLFQVMARQDLPFRVEFSGWQFSSGDFVFPPSRHLLDQTLIQWCLTTDQLLLYNLQMQWTVAEHGLIHEYSFGHGKLPPALLFEQGLDLHLAWIGNNFLLDAKFLFYD